MTGDFGKIKHTRRYAQALSSGDVSTGKKIIHPPPYHASPYHASIHSVYFEFILEDNV